MSLKRKARPKKFNRREVAKHQRRDVHHYLYNHTVFASMIEVAWAAFFDALGMRWDYEPRVVVLPDGRIYPPDFYLFDLGVYVECKGQVLEDGLMEKLEAATKELRKPILLLKGSPQRAVFKMGPEMGIELLMPTAMGVLKIDNLNFAECTGCGRVLIHRPEPNRVYYGCRCRNNYKQEVRIGERIKTAARTRTAEETVDLRRLPEYH